MCSPTTILDACVHGQEATSLGPHRPSAAHAKVHGLAYNRYTCTHEHVHALTYNRCIAQAAQAEYCTRTLFTCVCSTRMRSGHGRELMCGAMQPRVLSAVECAVSVYVGTCEPHFTRVCIRRVICVSCMGRTEARICIFVRDCVSVVHTSVCVFVSAYVLVRLCGLACLMYGSACTYPLYASVCTYPCAVPSVCNPGGVPIVLECAHACVYGARRVWPEHCIFRT